MKSKERFSVYAEVSAINRSAPKQPLPISPYIPPLFFLHSRMPMAKQLLAFVAFVLVIFLFDFSTTTGARSTAYDGQPVGPNDIIADGSESAKLRPDDIIGVKRPRPPDRQLDQIIGVKRPRPPDLQLDQIIGVKRPRPPDRQLDQIIGVKRPRPPDLQPDQIIGVKRPRPPDLQPDEIIGVKRPRPPKLQADPPPLIPSATISKPAKDTTQAAKNLVAHSGFSTESKVPPTPSIRVRQFGFSTSFGVPSK